MPSKFTAELPALPNWLPRDDGIVDEQHNGGVSKRGRPDLYDIELRAAGPGGTVVAYRIETFHRGTALVAPRGARYTIHANFRRADSDWIGRRSWVECANKPGWHAFVTSATSRQLQLFGFPPPGHQYWSQRTVEGLQQRYPGFDPRPWLNT